MENEKNYYVLTSDGELYHAGIKGMRWGVRRYQNSDGTLTSAGKRRYARDAKEQGWQIGNDGVARSTGKKNRGEVHEADPDKWVREDLNRSKKLADEASQLTNKLKNANDASIRNKPKKRADLSEMSDKEMRDKINRELLERQYNDIFTPQKTSKGRKFASKTLEVAGTLLGIGSSALGIALAIKELKG